MNWIVQKKNPLFSIIISKIYRSVIYCAYNFLFYKKMQKRKISKSREKYSKMHLSKNQKRERNVEIYTLNAVRCRSYNISQNTPTEIYYRYDILQSRKKEKKPLQAAFLCEFTEKL